MLLPSIEEKLDGLDPGGTLAMERGDYGPCVINKPVILICDGATFWTDGNVPAVTVQSPGVVIKDAKMRSLDTASHVVISAAKDSHPLLKNIHIFGKAVGVEPEPAEWIVPEGIHTGEIPANHPGFFVDFAVPQRSQIVCRISGVSMDPSALSPGINTVKLRISDALPDSILIGEIEVIGSALTRLIPFFARISASPSVNSSGDALPLIEISEQEKERFQKWLTESAPAGSQPSSTIKSQTARQSSKQKTQSGPALERPQQQPKRVSKQAEKTQAKPGKRKSTPAAREDPLKLGGAFAESAKEIRRLRRYPIYILADCSGAMPGDPIKSVMAVISAIHSELMNDPFAVESAYLSVITFGSHAKQVVPLTEIYSFTPPKLDASGARAMGDALRLLCLDLTASKQKGYITDYKPYVILLTGGAPTDDWQQYADSLKTKKPLHIIAISCRNGADTEHLEYITDTVLEMKNMSPSDFSGFFKWFIDSGPLPKSEAMSIDTPPGGTSIALHLLGKPSLLFVGNAPIDKPFDLVNRTQTDQGQAKGDHDEALKTSQLSKLFTDLRD